MTEPDEHMAGGYVVTPGPAEGDWRWIEGVVDRKAERLLITYKNGSPVATVGKGAEHTYVVQFHSQSSEVREAVQGEIDFYLTEWGGKNPWAYAIYHCGTASNAYSDVKWHYFPGGNDTV